MAYWSYDSQEWDWKLSDRQDIVDRAKEAMKAQKTPGTPVLSLEDYLEKYLAITDADVFKMADFRKWVFSTFTSMDPFDVQHNEVLKVSVNPDKDQQGKLNTIMFDAITHYRLGALWLACYYGADVNAKDKYGQTPLMFATHKRFQHPSVIATLLSFGA